MENIFILAIVIGTAIFIALPFFKDRFEGKSQEETNTVNSPLEDELRKLNSEKESLYTALKEFDFDYSMGKLSEEDYEELKNKYKARAIGVLKEIDDIGKGLDASEGLEEEVEREIRIVREVELADEEEVEREILQARKSRLEGAFCSSCGNEYKPDDRFCSRCGARLRG